MWPESPAQGWPIYMLVGDVQGVGLLHLILTAHFAEFKRCAAVRCPPQELSLPACEHVTRMLRQTVTESESKHRAAGCPHCECADGAGGQRWVGVRALMSVALCEVADCAAVRVQVECEVGAPRVNYRETIQSRAEFDYLHKKQSGGQVSPPCCRTLNRDWVWGCIGLLA